MGSIPGWGTKIPHAVCLINKTKQFFKNLKKQWNIYIIYNAMEYRFPFILHKQDTMHTICY